MQSHSTLHKVLKSNQMFGERRLNMLLSNRRGFCGMVHGVDRQIGKVISTLEKHNLMDNTIIVFSSDNGGSPWSGGFNYPFRGAKMTPLEGGVRVPGFIYGPKFLKNKSGQ